MVWSSLAGDRAAFLDAEVDPTLEPTDEDVVVDHGLFGEEEGDDVPEENSEDAVNAAAAASASSTLRVRALLSCATDSPLSRLHSPHAIFLPHAHTRLVPPPPPCRPATRPR